MCFFVAMLEKRCEKLCSVEKLARSSEESLGKFGQVHVAFFGVCVASLTLFLCDCYNHYFAFLIPFYISKELHIMDLDIATIQAQLFELAEVGHSFR